MEEERSWSLLAQASQGISKEQIMILECLIRYGIQTPSASQIQQITAKLRDYGSIDENFVFFWFQNYHQRKNEESSAYALLQMPPLPTLSPPPQQLPPLTPQVYTNGLVYNPFPLRPGHASSLGNYQPQCPNIILPEATRKRHASELHMLEMASNGNTSSASGYVPPKTLQLFPLHPDGTLSSFARSQNKRRRVENEEDGKARMSNFFQLFDGRSGD